MLIAAITLMAVGSLGVGSTVVATALTVKCPVDPDEGLERRPEVEERLKELLDTPREELLASEEMRAQDRRQYRHSQRARGRQ